MDDKPKLAYVTPSGVLIMKKDLTQEQNVKLKKLCRFTVMRKGSPSQAPYPQTITSIITLKDAFYIPKFVNHGLQCENKLQFNKIETKCSIQPIDNQTKIIEHLMNKVFTEENKAKGMGGVSLKASTGIGKSFIAYMCIGKLQVKTLIVVPNISVAEQHVKLLKECMTCSIGSYHSKRKEDGDVVVAVIHSLMMDKMKFKNGDIDTLKYLRKFSFVVYDEPQLYISAKRRGVFNRTSSVYSLALSATYEDAKGLEKWIFQRAGPLYDISHLGEDYKWNLKTHLVYYNGPDKFTERLLNSQGMNDYGETIRMLGTDPYRNKLGIDIAKANQGRGVYIITWHKVHVKLLAGLLNNIKVDYEAPEVVNVIEITLKHYDAIIQLINTMKTKKDLFLRTFKTINNTKSLDCLSIIYKEALPYKQESFYRKKVEGIAKQFNTGATTLYGDSDKHDRSSALKTPILITTFAYGSVGISIKEKTCLILFMPEMAKQKQCVGRILRKGYDDTKERHIYDIVDNRCWIKKQLTARKRIYREHPKNEYIKTIVSWDTI